MTTQHARCKAQNADGEPCEAPAVHDSLFCFWHDPESAVEARAARRRGGLRRRRDKALLGSYDIEALDNVGAIRRIVEVAMIDALRLENSVARSRVLIAGAAVAMHLLEIGELEDQVRLLRLALTPRIASKGVNRGQP
jgi:hypothetical protein